jgi:hypothetical protein
MRPPEQRVQRRPQLVRERGEEVFLQSVGLLRVPVQERIVQREPRSRAQVRRQRDVALAVRPPLVERPHAEQAERASAGAQRRHHERANGEARQQREMFRALCRPRHHVGRALVRHQRLAAADRFGRRAVERERRRILPQRFRDLGLHGIGDDERHAVEQAVVAQHVDGAVVAEHRRGALRELAERRLVFERRGEDAARVGEEPLFLLDAPALRDVDRDRNSPHACPSSSSSGAA